MSAIDALKREIDSTEKRLAELKRTLDAEMDGVIRCCAIHNDYAVVSEYEEYAFLTIHQSGQETGIALDKEAVQKLNRSLNAALRRAS